jgi:hypothetical protein
LQEVARILEFENKVDFSIAFTVEWKDERIFFCPDVIHPEDEVLDTNSIYRPDLYVYNLLEQKPIKSFLGSSEYVLLLANGGIM